jgi:hypothetical protein
VGFHLLVESLRKSGGSPFRELPPAKLSGDPLDPVGRDALNDHLHKRQNKGLEWTRPSRPLIALKQLRREGTVLTARDLKGELSDASVQLTFVGTVPIAGPRSVHSGLLQDDRSSRPEESDSSPRP